MAAAKAKTTPIDKWIQKVTHLFSPCKYLLSWLDKPFLVQYQCFHLVLVHFYSGE